MDHHHDLSAHHADSSPPLLIWIWVFSRRRHRIVKHKDRSLETEAVRSKIRLILDLIPSPTQMQSPFNVLRNCSYSKPPRGEPVRLRRIIPAPEPESIPSPVGANPLGCPGWGRSPELAESPPRRIEGSSGGGTALSNPSWSSPKSDTNPLTLFEHLYYPPPRQARHTPKPKEEPQPREAHPAPPEDSTPQPIPTALAQARGTSESGTSAYGGPPSPHPHRIPGTLP